MTDIRIRSENLVEGQEPRRRRRGALYFGAVLSALVIFALILLSFAIGAKPISLGVVWESLIHYNGSQDHVIVVKTRLPRTILGLLAGAALGLAGALMQSLTRNPLADPGILGVNAGASLAIVVAVAVASVTTPGGYIWFALVGAGIATFVVYTIGATGRAGASPVRLALAGAAIAAVFAGLTSLIVLLNRNAFQSFRSWTVGSLQARDLQVVVQVVPFIIVGLVIAYLMVKSLDSLALGDDAARALGTNVTATRLLGLAATTLLCGAATAAVGPIAFAGLMAAHVARGITGPQNRWLLIYSTLGGAVLLLGADIIGRVVLWPGELEVGVVTALVGAPVFILMVRRKKLAKV